jgi:hypothetical protein
MADIGSTLREARMRAGIDITEVETQTKIRARYLRAMENEEWDLLPGSVYVKSFLRSYADYLGLDGRTLVDEYKRRYERPSDHELRPISALHRERDRAARGSRLPSWAPIGVVLVAVVAALYFLGRGSSNTPTPTTSAKTVPNHRHTRQRSRRARVVAVPSTVKLQLVPTGAVWVCLVNGSGVKLIDQRTFNSGDRIPVHTASRLLLTLGNASVHMKVNGRPVPIAQSSNAIRLLIKPSGVQHIPLSMTPTCP